jgi:hypothetical protein
METPAMGAIPANNGRSRIILLYVTRTTTKGGRYEHYDIVAADTGVRSALKGLAPGQYNLPHCKDPSEFKEPAMAKKLQDGPIAFITVLPSGVPNMTPQLVMMFGYNLLVAFVSYGMAYVQESVWFGRLWSSTAKTFLDALIYAVLTGGVFGWLA